MPLACSVALFSLRRRQALADREIILFLELEESVPCPEEPLEAKYMPRLFTWTVQPAVASRFMESFVHMEGTASPSVTVHGIVCSHGRYSQL
jgi:hypothetical protein